MKIKDIMTAQPRTCTPDMTVAAAAHEMWEGDCGILPVVEHGALVGAVTDRDMYIALATRDRRASELTVGEVTTRLVLTCGPEDDIHEALALMKRAMVRRLPVIDPAGAVIGLISMDDIVRVAGPRKAVRTDEVVETLREIYSHHLQVARPGVA
jgi:CBS domain-containing protein